MNRWYRFAGYLGLVLVLFGVGGGLIINDFSTPLVLFHLILGVLLLIVWLISSGSASLSGAGSLVSTRGARFGAHAVLYSSIFVGLLTVGNWFVQRSEKRWDLTAESVYSLAPQSQTVIEALKKPLRLVAFKGTEAVSDEEVEQLFEQYRYYNASQVSSEIIDPRSRPELVDTYEMKPGNLVYLEYGEGDSKGVSRINEVSEEAITNAIIKLTRGEAKKIYFVEGHNEPSTQDANPTGIRELAEAIKDEHLSVDTLFLGEREAIPQDAAAVVLVSPKKPLQQAERDMLVSYAQSGGRLILFSDPRTTQDIASIASSFGVALGQDVVIDQVQRLFAGPALGVQPLVREYGDHPIAKGFSNNSVTIFNLASSVSKSASADSAATYTELLKTGATAWGETNLSLLFDSGEPTAILEDSDVKGPITLAIAYEKNVSSADQSKQPSPDDDGAEQKFEKVSRVVVFGDSDWVLNANFSIYSNRDLVLNTINWLVGEEGGISIRPRSLRASIAPISQDSFDYILASSFVVPELILILGLLFWWSRRTAEAY